MARGYEVKVFTKDGNVTKFEGFKESVWDIDVYCTYHIINPFVS